MKYIKQLMIILLFSFLGELLNQVIPLPIPASIYGMLLMFLALNFKILKLEQIQETSEYLLSIMLILFVPAAVGIMDTFFAYQSSILPICFIVLVSTIIVMVVTGVVSQFIAKITLSLKKTKNKILLLAERAGDR